MIILFSYPAFAIFLASCLSYRYLKNTLLIAGLTLSGLLFALPFYERDRFQTKALQIIKNSQEPVYFYRGAEISSVVFYLQRCIPKIDQPPPEKALLISKEEIKGCQRLLTGREFDGVYGLYLCSP